MKGTHVYIINTYMNIFCVDVSCSTCHPDVGNKLIQETLEQHELGPGTCLGPRRG